MKPVIYLSIPYSLVKNKEKLMKYVRECRFKLEQMGYIIFSPLDHTHGYSLQIREQSHEYWLKQDLGLLEAFASVVVVAMDRCAYQQLYAWKKVWYSDGCRQEYEKALSLHIRVIDLQILLKTGKMKDV